MRSWPRLCGRSDATGAGADRRAAGLVRAMPPRPPPATGRRVAGLNYREHTSGQQREGQDHGLGTERQGRHRDGWQRRDRQGGGDGAGRGGGAGRDLRAAPGRAGGGGGGDPGGRRRRGPHDPLRRDRRIPGAGDGPAGRRGVGPAGHPGQQRRHVGGGQVRGRQQRGLGRRPATEAVRRDLLQPGGAAAPQAGPRTAAGSSTSRRRAAKRRGPARCRHRPRGRPGWR